MSRLLCARAALLGLPLLLGACRAQPVPLPSPHLTPTPVPAGALVVKNGMVVDGTGAEPFWDGLVVIIGNRIAAVGRAVDFALSPQVKVLDARGGAILPGIINAHVHDAASALVRQYYFLSQGVTSACDMATPLSTMSQFQDKGLSLTARGFHSGPIINMPRGYPGTEELLYPVSSAAEAGAAAGDILDRGADYIKLALEPGNSKLPWPSEMSQPIPNLDLPALRVVVNAAHVRGKLVRVHVGTAEVLDLALDAGVDTIEHVPLPRLADIDFQPGKLSPRYEAQLARMVQQRVVMVPTLDKIIAWCQGFAYTPERKALCAQYALIPARRFYQMGGTLALGDDSGYMARTGMPVAEMRRLLEIGMPPLQVLQAGTRTAAQVCGHGDVLGTLEPGKLADLIVVAGNPLVDINVMGRVTLVIVDGQVAVPPP